jgi:hypothetical protein
VTRELTLCYTTVKYLVPLFARRFDFIYLAWWQTLFTRRQFQRASRHDESRWTAYSNGLEMIAFGSKIVVSHLTFHKQCIWHRAGYGQEITEVARRLCTDRTNLRKSESWTKLNRLHRHENARIRINVLFCWMPSTGRS